jgi:hypothetical protein
MGGPWDCGSIRGQGTSSNAASSSASESASQVAGIVKSDLWVRTNEISRFLDQFRIRIRRCPIDCSVSRSQTVSVRQ